MKIESLRSLRGPNLWSDQTVLEALASFEGPVDVALARRVAEQAIALQQAVGCSVAFANVLPVSDHECRLLVQYSEEEVGKRALELAIESPLQSVDQTK